MSKTGMGLKRFRRWYKMGDWRYVMANKIVFFEVDEPGIKAQIESLAGAWTDKAFAEEPLKPENAARYSGCEIVSCFIYSEIGMETLDRLPNLKMIATRSTGHDHIDIDLCRERGIVVTNVPTYGENTVAEHAFALILALSRNVHKAYKRTSSFDLSIAGLKGFDLYKKTLGIVGAGNIGLHAIRIGKGFGMRVLAYDVRENQLLSDVLGFTYTDLDTLLAESDVISLHAPLLPSTRHMINAETIGKMKKGVLLINTSRGGLVDTDALMQALDNGHVAGAGLDVFEGEELIREEAELLKYSEGSDKLQQVLKSYMMLRRDNVVITPHIGFYSQEAEDKIIQTTLHNIQVFLEGENPPDRL